MKQTLCLAALAAAILAVPSLRAEQDYEFAKALMDRKESSFNTDDLIQRLIAKLDEANNTKLDSKLIKATFLRRQASEMAAGKKVELLGEAAALFKEVASGPNTYRLFDVATKEATSIREDVIRAKIEEAKDKDPAKAKELRTEAATMMAAEAAPFKAASEAAKAKFDPAFKAMNDWQEKNNKDQNKQVPREVLKPVEDSYDDWIINDKRYLVTKLKQLSVYDDSDTAKKPLAEELAKLCQERIDNDAVGQFITVMSWYQFIQGRIYSEVGEEEKAAAAWKDALNVEMTGMSTHEKAQILDLKKRIGHALVKMRMKSKKYPEVEEIINQLRFDPDTQKMFEQDLGKELIIDYVKALTIPAETQAEYEKAVKVLREFVTKERARGANTIWANEFSRAMAEILLDARSKKLLPRLDAPEWYDAARGFFLMGQYRFGQYEKFSRDEATKKKAQDEYDESYKEFSNAVDHYRRAIAVARSEKTDLVTRLKVEPNSWFEMGLSYIKMGHYYEAVISNKAMYDTFAKDARSRWLPDAKTPEGKKAITKPVTDALSELDKPRQGLVAKASANIMVALERNEAAHKNPQDQFNRGLKAKYLGNAGEDLLLRITEDMPTDVQYMAGRAEMDGGKGLVDSAKNDTPERADESYTQGIGKYMTAIEKFGQVKTSSEAYELALVQIANCYTQAQAVYGTGKIKKMKMAALEEKSKELSVKGLEAFKKYEEYVAKTPPKSEKEKDRRKSVEGVIMLAKNTLHSGAQNWDMVIKTTDEITAWELANQPKSSVLDVAMLNKYRALIEVAATKRGQEAEPYLKQAEEAMNSLRKHKPNDNKLYVFMLNALYRRYNISALQLERDKQKKVANLPANIDEIINGFEFKLAELQGIRVDFVEDDPNEDTNLEDHSRLVYLFHRTGQLKKAADAARRLLAKFDPKNENMKLKDDEAIWKPILDQMLMQTKYDDLNKWDRCKKDHTILVDYMYDTRQGAQLAENNEKRPPTDRLNLNMEKALKQLDTIRNNYPDVQTLKAPAAGGAPLLAKVEEEIDFRRKIEATRDLLSDLALDVAEKLEKDGQPEVAKEYRETAIAQIKVLKELKGDSPAMAIKTADIEVSVGHLDEALVTLRNVLPTVEPGSSTYFSASRKIAEILAKQKKWKEASEYPEFIATTIGFNANLVKEKWPGMEAFLDSCYANGVTRPARLIKKEAPKVEAPKTEPAPEK